LDCQVAESADYRRGVSQASPCFAAFVVRLNFLDLESRLGEEEGRVGLFPSRPIIPGKRRGKFVDRPFRVAAAAKSWALPGSM
jgi:hypothetical protein